MLLWICLPFSGITFRKLLHIRPTFGPWACALLLFRFRNAIIYFQDKKTALGLKESLKVPQVWILQVVWNFPLFLLKSWLLTLRDRLFLISEMGFENWEGGQSNFCESSCFRWLHIVYNFTLRKPSSQIFPSSRNLRCDVGKYLCKDDFLLLALLFVDDCSSQTTWPIHNTQESWEILCICKTCLQHPGIRVMVPSPRYAAPRFVLPRNCCLFMKRRGKYG